MCFSPEKTKIVNFFFSITRPAYLLEGRRKNYREEVLPNKTTLSISLVLLVAVGKRRREGRKEERVREGRGNHKQREKEKNGKVEEQEKDHQIEN